MKPVISPVPGAFVFLCADGVYTDAPLFVGPFDCGFVRNPKGEGYLRLHYLGETSVPGVTYSGVWGAVLAKAELGNDAVVTPVEGRPAPQVDWSKESPGDAGKVRDSLSRVCNIARLCTVDPAVGVDNVLATSRRIDDLLYEARNARFACDRIIGSYQKKAKLGNDTVVTPSPQDDCPQVDYPQADWSKENQGDAEEARPQPAIREALCVDSAAKIRWHLNCAAEISTQYTARPADDPEGVLAAIGRIEIHTSTIRALCHKMIGSYQKGD